MTIRDIPGIASLRITARDLGGHLGFETPKNVPVRRNRALKRLTDQAIAGPRRLLALPRRDGSALVDWAAALWIVKLKKGDRGDRLGVWELRSTERIGHRLLEENLKKTVMIVLQHDPRGATGLAGSPIEGRRSGRSRPRATGR
jgi:hypothetical protein